MNIEPINNQEPIKIDPRGFYGEDFKTYSGDFTNEELDRMEECDCHSFDLEEQIMDCWGILEDLSLVSENVLEGNPTQDETFNVLFGIQELYKLKFNKLWKAYESSLRNK